MSEQERERIRAAAKEAARALSPLTDDQVQRVAALLRAGARWTTS